MLRVISQKMIVILITLTISAPVFAATATNLSLNKKTKQSSVRAGQAGHFAVDGNKSSKNQMQTEPQKQPWWEVDLGEVSEISYIKIYNRNSNPRTYAERLRNYYIFVSDNPIKGKTVDAVKKEVGVKAFLQTAQVEFPSKVTLNTKGRFVRIQLVGSNYLHMTEVEVIRDVPVVVNLSLNKKTNQSSIRAGQAGRFAVDGDKSRSNQMQTEGQRQPWWEVDLEQVSNINFLNIYNRNTSPITYGERLRNYYIFVSDIPIKGKTVTAVKEEAGVKAFLQTEQAQFPSKITLNTKGRFVRIQLVASNYLHMTEVEVFGSETVSPPDDTDDPDDLDDTDDPDDLDDTDDPEDPEDPDDPKEDEDGLPKGINEDLPMLGMFYGATKGGLQTGNSSIALYHSIRFRAEKTGYIKAMRYNNRQLTTAQVRNRCASYPDTGSHAVSKALYCACVDAGLTGAQCGFTIGSSYSIGTGGNLEVQVRPDDGTFKHWPGDKILGKTNKFVPSNLSGGSSSYPIIPFTTPAYVEAGKIYHLYYENYSPPNCGYSRVPVSEAKNCKGGAISLNGTWEGKERGPSINGNAGEWGPYIGDIGGGVLTRFSRTADWKENNKNIPFYEVQYNDGVWVGESSAGYKNVDAGKDISGSQVITGNKMGRQVFTVQDADRIVNGMWLQYGHAYYGMNGKPMTVKVKSSTGVVLATGSLQASQYCADISKNWDKPKQDYGKRYCKAWGYTDLTQEVTFKKGSKYTVELSSPSGANFVVSSFFNLTYANWQSKNRNLWHESQAEYSKNNGGTWGSWTSNYKDRDLPMIFTIKGMPKSLGILNEMNDPNSKPVDGENLALKKKARQSSNINNSQFASVAVDGKLGTKNHTQTKSQKQPWWEVDLGKVADIDTVRIYNRNTTPKTFGERLEKFYVFVSKDPFASNDPQITKNQSHVLNFYHNEKAGVITEIDVNGSGRYVRIQLTGTNYLHMTEVEVDGR